MSRVLTMNNQLLRRIFIYLSGIIGGLIIGYAYYLISDQNLLNKSLIWGAILGLSFTVLLPIFRPGLIDYRFKEIHLSIPQFSEMTFVVDDSNRHVAWSLFIETITRITTQPLDTDEGFLREALSSLYGLFQITRDLLKSMEPSKDVSGNKMTVEMFAISMLNDELRPFLAKWHPLLTNFETRFPDKLDSEWDLNSECREELNKLRSQIMDYARGFGELAEVKNLEFFFKKQGG